MAIQTSSFVAGPHGSLYCNGAARLSLHDGRLRLTLHGAWSPEVEALVQEAGVTEVALNYALGWPGGSLAFLAAMPRLEALWLLERRPIDLTPIAELESLRVLALEAPLAAGAPDLAPLTRLEVYRGQWMHGFEPLLTLPILRELWLWHYPARRSGALLSLMQVERLGLISTRLTELAGLAQLPRLQALLVAHNRVLATMAPLAGHPRLESLSLERCPQIGDLEFVRGLPQLRRLAVSDCSEVDSVAPLRGLAELEVLDLGGSTNIVDGDLGALLTLPKLRTLGMLNRRHYRPQLRELPREWGQSTLDFAWL